MMDYYEEYITVSMALNFPGSSSDSVSTQNYVFWNLNTSGNLNLTFAVWTESVAVAEPGALALTLLALGLASRLNTRRTSPCQLRAYP
jgi:hypothetical protein